MVGRLLDNRYQLTEKIGSGGMADVYRAQDVLLDRVVAVKILHSNFATDNDFVVRFRREAQAAAKLSHPNIVNIYDVGKDNEVYYIVMEYVGGETLKDYIARQGRLSNEAAVRIAIEIAEALEHAHANGLIHCDIKPHNILVTKTGRIKVADFGIARAINTVTIANKQSVLGSVHYFSPEQASGDPLTPQTDMYSLGIVLYEMLTGHLPFEGETAVSIALKHMQEDIPKPAKYNPTISPMLEDCVMKALQKDPHKRFNDISEMIAELRLAQGLVTPKNAKTGRHDFSTGQFPRTRPIPKTDLEPKESVLTPILSWPVRWIVLGIAGLFLLASGIAFWMFGDFWSPDSMTLPNVVGQQVEVAQKTLTSKNLNVRISEIASEDVPIGQVISQTPSAGMEVKTHRIIHLTISKGGSNILIPDLTGLTIEQATAKLNSIHLRLGKIEEREDSSRPLDTIIGQSPLAPNKVEADTSVNVVVNKKDMVSRVATPGIVGKTWKETKQILKQADLTVGSLTRDGKDVTPADGDLVTAQNPSAGQAIVRGSSVDLTFDKLEEKKANVGIRVPNDGKSHHVEIIVTDDTGRHTVFSANEKAGATINQRVTGSGQVRVQVLIDNAIVQDQEL